MYWISTRVIKMAMLYRWFGVYHCQWSQNSVKASRLFVQIALLPFLSSFSCDRLNFNEIVQYHLISHIIYFVYTFLWIYIMNIPEILLAWRDITIYQFQWRVPGIYYLLFLFQDSNNIYGCYPEVSYILPLCTCYFVVFQNIRAF
jgi:hypothetical protein